MRKNVAGQHIGAQMVSASDGSAFTGSVTVAVTVDAGTQATGSVGSGACTHEGGGYHTYAPAQAETNGNLLAFSFSGTGAVPVTVQVYTTSLDPHDTVRAGLTALPNAAADAAGGLPISDAGGLDLDAKLAATNEVTSARMGALTDWIDGGRLDLILDAILDDTDLIDDGTSGLAKIATDVAAILVDTAEIGAAGAGLTEAGGTGDHLTAINLPNQTMDIVGNITGNLSGSVGSVTGNVGGNVTGSVGSLATQAKADVNAEADAAIETYHLDHLLAATYDPASKPGAADALLNELVESDSGVSRFTVNSLENAPSGSGASAEAIADEVQTRTIAAVTLVATVTNLTNAPTSGDLTATMKTSVQTAAAAALAAYDPPTHAEVTSAFTEVKGATWATTDTLEAIRDRGDAAWITATGFSTLDAAGVRTALGLASANLDTQLAAIVADTNELQTDWANGGRLDLLIDAVKAKTDILPASFPSNFSSFVISAAGIASADVKKINATTIIGDGSSGSKFRV